MVKKNACIFISGKGSNLKNLILRSRDYSFPVSIKLVISDQKKALGLLHAKKNSIPYVIIDTNSRNYENKIIKDLKKYNIYLICLAGYMKILSKKFLKNFGKKIINIHPSLLPKFKGLNTFSRILKNKEKKTGCTVHYVNSKLDSGKVIIQKKVKILKSDTPKTLQKRILLEEHKLYSKALNMIIG